MPIAWKEKKEGWTQVIIVLTRAILKDFVVQNDVMGALEYHPDHRWQCVRAVPTKIRAPPMDGNRFFPEGVVGFN